MHLSNFLNAEHVICGKQPKNLEEARELMLELYSTSTQQDPQLVKEALIEREKLGSTIIAPGIAIPHIRESFLKDFYVFVGLYPDGVEAPAGQDPIRLSVTFLVPEGKSNLYLRVLSGFSKLMAANPLEKLANIKSGEEFLELVKSTDIQVGEIVTAENLMDRDFIALPESATLREAADKMVENRITDIPIINASGDFVGLVTTGRLLKVGIPDYLLMMDNLSFLKSFEPFQDLLKQEQTMKVTEVMKKEVPSFAVNTPMIQVAGKLIEKHVELGVVLDGKKLVGTISRFDFLHKVVRV